MCWLQLPGNELHECKGQPLAESLQLPRSCPPLGVAGNDLAQAAQ
jgi:hypothetical protein